MVGGPPLSDALKINTTSAQKLLEYPEMLVLRINEQSALSSGFVLEASGTPEDWPPNQPFSREEAALGPHPCL